MIRLTRRALAEGLVALAAAGCRDEARSVDLWLGGDLHLGRGGQAVLEGLAPRLAGAVGLANLEGPVGEEARCEALARSPETICLANDPTSLAAAHRAGLRGLGIANNHMHDLGPGAPGRTARALRARGLAAIGPEPAVFVRSGRGVAVVAHDLSAGLPPRLDEGLRAARRLADDLLVFFHVTGPPSYLPRPPLKRAVGAAIAAGARVVASHGSHAIGPVERRGEAVIAWGLGNLSFACDCTRERDALLLRVSLGRGPVRATVIPIDAGLSGAPARPASDPELTLDLLAALGSTPLEREGRIARLI